MQPGLSLRTLSRISNSKLSTAIEAFWEKSAQHSGVAKVRTTPQNRTWIGEFAQRKRFKIVVFFSRKFIRTGVRTIPKTKAIVSLLPSQPWFDWPTWTSHEDSWQRDLSYALLCSNDWVSVYNSVFISDWHSRLKLSESIKKEINKFQHDNFVASLSYCILINGILTQLAAATAEMETVTKLFANQSRQFNPTCERNQFRENSSGILCLLIPVFLKNFVWRMMLRATELQKFC